MLFGLGLTLKYWGSCKKNLNEEGLGPAPESPYLGFFLLVLFFVSAVLTTAKVFDLKTHRGTVTASQVSVLATPDKESPVIYELFEGLEVIIKNTQGLWVQVKYPGGLTGWIKSKNLFQTSGRYYGQ